MTLNYIQEFKARMVAIEDEIHVVLSKSPSAKDYGIFTTDAYPYWRNIMGDYQITGTDDGSKIRTHTFYAVWTLGAFSSGEEGDLEGFADEYIPSVLDYIQARPTLQSTLYPGQFRFLYGDTYVSNGTGIIRTASLDGTKITASTTFTLIAPFRVQALRS